MNSLIHEGFADEKDLIEFVKYHKIIRDDIQQITSTNCGSHLFYYGDVKGRKHDG